jgi:hypothetical protein
MLIIRADSTYVYHKKKHLSDYIIFFLWDSGGMRFDVPFGAQ